MVDVVAHLDLSAIYARYHVRGGEAYAPEVLIALLFYGYATGVFSARKIEKATYEGLPFRHVGGDLHPDHDTLANFRKTLRSEIKDLFVQVLLLAQTAGYLKLGSISLDGSKVHANALKSRAVSYQRLLELESQLRQEVEQLFVLAEQVNGGNLPAGLNVADEVAIREQRLALLAAAKAVLEARAAERYAAEQAEFEAKQRERNAQAKRNQRKPPGRPPEPPTPGPRAGDQYNFIDPDSRIMKCSNIGGFEQAYNGQVAGYQATLLIVAHALSNHPNDKAEAAPTLAALPVALGTPADASPKVQMAYKLQTAIGKEIYRLRKATVEPVIGMIKAVLGFRQFSLRSLTVVSDEWALVCLAFNLKRLHTLSRGEPRPTHGFNA